MKSFVTTCVNAHGPDISDMTDVAEEITYEEFVEEIGHEALDELERGMGYGSHLRLENDYHVRYYRSTYQGKLCVYMDHSAIEHVFV